MTIVKEYLDYTIKWKKEYGEKTLVLMQVGSFFESYGLLDKDNNIYGSEIINFAEINDMTVSRKNICVGDAKVVMAGFGLPQLEKYVKKLQDNGYTIVVYTQDIQGKNTTRSLHTIFSPGTYFSNDTKELSNNITCIWIHYSEATIVTNEQISIGVSNIDIYTGMTSIFEFSKDYLHNPTTYDELERYISIYRPNECIIVSNLDENTINDIINFTSINSNKIHKINITDETDLGKFARNAEKQIYQEEIIKRFYPTKNDEILLNNLQIYCIAVQSFIYLLDFVYKHNPNLINNISEPLYENYTDRLILANHSLKQLNIISDNRFNGKYSCVSKLLNNCITSMGKRKFLYNLLNPTTDINALNKSYNITEHLLAMGRSATPLQTLEVDDLINPVDKNNLVARVCKGATPLPWTHYRTSLNDIRDIEKLRRKLIMKKITPKDFTLLYDNLRSILELHKTTQKDKKMSNYLNDPIDLSDVSEICKKCIDDIKKTLDLNKSKFIDDISQEKLGNYDTNNVFYINRGIDEKLDAYYKKTLDSKQQLECIRKLFSDLIITYEKTSTKTSEFVKIHETAKMDAILLATKRRCTFLKKILENKGDDVVLKYKSDYSDNEETYVLNLKSIEYVSHGGNQNSIVITSPEIRAIESAINTSKSELIRELEIYYHKFMNNFMKHNIDNIILFVIQLDITQCKCYIASEYNYCKPIIEKRDKSFIKFTGLRHCLIEHLNTREIYVTNDLKLGRENPKSNQEKNKGGFKDVSHLEDSKDNKGGFPLYTDGILLYGTNAVGKTSFIKAIGISIIMAQAGLYVPASEFVYNPYNSIFTRILGNDNIFKGLSTFAVEMSELRTILQMADKNSLILGDELCSGTESDSALSIFVSGLEILHEKRCTFLFATHFKQILEFDEVKKLDRMKIYHMSVIFNNELNKLIYNRKLKEGPGIGLYGLEVAKSLDLQDELIKRAYEIRNKYSDYINYILDTKKSTYNSKKLKEKVCEICNEFVSSDIHHLQFQQKANDKGLINDEFHKNHAANLISICNDCHDNIHKNNIQYKKVKTTRGYELQEI